MKTSIVSAALISSLLAAFPACAQDAAVPAPAPVQAAPAVPDVAPAPAPDPAKAADAVKNSKLFKAYMGAMKDLRPLMGLHSDMKGFVMKLDQFSFSPETKAYLQDAFGNDNPLHFVVTPQEDGTTLLSSTFDSVDYKTEDASVIAHSGKLTTDAIFNKEFNKYRFTLAYPGLTIDVPKSLHFEIGNASATGNYTQGPYGLWLGDTNLKLDHMDGASPDGKFAVKAENFVVDMGISTRNKLLNVSYDYKIGDIDWGKDRVDNVNFSLGFLNLDAKALADFADYSKHLNIDATNDPAQVAAVLKMLQQFALAMSKHNSAIEIRDISAAYHGQTASMSGRIALPGMVEADFKKPQKIYEKLVLKIKLSVPMAMIDDISHRVARKIMEEQSKQNNAQVTDMAVDLVARGMASKVTDVFVTKQKWAHLEKDTLVTVFEIRKGKLYLDNHVVNAQSNPFMAMMAGK